MYPLLHWQWKLPFVSMQSWEQLSMSVQLGILSSDNSNDMNTVWGGQINQPLHVIVNWNNCISLCIEHGNFPFCQATVDTFFQTIQACNGWLIWPPHTVFHIKYFPDVNECLIATDNNCISTLHWHERKFPFCHATVDTFFPQTIQHAMVG